MSNTVFRDRAEIQRAIDHLVDGARGSRELGHYTEAAATLAIARALRWVLGEDGDFSTLLRLLNSVGTPPPSRRE